MVTGKFQVVERAKVSYSQTGERVKLQAVYGGGPENDAYHKYTPSGSIEMFVDNPAALEQLQLGKTYYVRFEEAPE